LTHSITLLSCVNGMDVLRGRRGHPLGVALLLYETLVPLNARDKHGRMGQIKKRPPAAANQRESLRIFYDLAVSPATFCCGNILA
jgi:hypothetical protein